MNVDIRDAVWASRAKGAPPKSLTNPTAQCEADKCFRYSIFLFQLGVSASVMHHPIESTGLAVLN